MYVQINLFQSKIFVFSFQIMLILYIKTTTTTAKKNLLNGHFDELFICLFVYLLITTKTSFFFYSHQWDYYI